MKGQLRIERLFAFVLVDDDGSEGVPAFRNGNMVLPMTGADMARVDELRPIAQQLADDFKKPITLVVFENRVEKEVISPRGAQPS
jgi:hypothetical protein